MADKVKVTMYDYAKSELDRAGFLDHPEPDARKTATDVLALIRRFEKQSHTEGTKEIVLEWFGILANFVPLSPITDNPEEWEKFEVTTKNEAGEEVTKELWQSRRAPSVISEDGGKSFIDNVTGSDGVSVPHEDWLTHREKQREKAIARMEAKKNPVKEDPAANVKADAPAATPEESTGDETVPTEETK
jgi:hypothetical protein